MGCGLRKEIESMLSLVRGKWKLRLDKYPTIILSRYKYKYVIEPVDKPFGNVVVFGHGWSKSEALANLLENWRRGGIRAQLECPAGSVEELSIKLAIRGDDDGETQS